MAEVNTEAAIRQQAAAEEFNARCNAVEAAGSKAFGDKWVQAKNDLAMLDDHGRIPMDILQVALETEDPAQVLFELGRDLGKADELMAMPALKRAIAMNDLAKAKLSVQLASNPRRRLQLLPAVRLMIPLSMGDELSAGVGVQISLGSGDWGSGISRHWDRRWSFQVGGRGVWAAARL
jgi:hypothetical protein